MIAVLFAVAVLAVMPTAANGAPAIGKEPAGSEDIAFVSDRTGDSDIYLTTSSGAPPINLTHDAAEDDGPAWSPDGARLAFASTRAGSWDLFVLDLGTGVVTQLTTGA